MILMTDRLTLHPLESPLNEQPSWLNDSRNTRFSEQRHHQHDKDSCAKYISQCSIFWGIQNVDTGEWIGTIAAHIDNYNKVADLGILIHFDYAGQGYGKEAWKAASDYLLDKLQMRKVEAGCMATNVAMRRLCETAGFFKDGTRTNHFLADNDRPVDLVYYGKWRG